MGERQENRDWEIETETGRPRERDRGGRERERQGGRGTETMEDGRKASLLVRQSSVGREPGL